MRPPVWLLGGLPLAVALALHAWQAAYNLDEFTIASDALRLLRGQVMYRDFFQFTGPLSHWLLAAAFLVAGPAIGAAHVLQAGLLGLNVLQLRDLATRLGVGPWLAWLPGYVLVFCLYWHYSGINHHWVAPVFVLGAAQAAFRGLEAEGPRWWLLAGTCAGLAGLAVQTDGIVAGVALAATVVGTAWLAGGPWPVAWRRLGWLGVGLAAPTLAAGAVFAAQGALGAAWYDMWVWPFAHYKGAGGFNDVPFATDLPALASPVTALPGWYGRLSHFALLYGLTLGATAVAAAWGLGLAWRRVRHGPGLSPMEARLGLTGLLALGSLAVATRGRADFVHLVMYASPAFLFATALVPRVAARLPGPHLALVRALPAGVLAAYVATGAMMFTKGVLGYPVTWLRTLTPDSRLRDWEIIRYLDAHARPGDRMVAVPFGGYFYFYGPPPATRYSVLLPPERGYNPLDEWRAVQAEIATTRPRFVVLAPMPTADRAATLARWAELLPAAGYRKVGALASPLWQGQGAPVLYEAEAGRPM